MVIFQLFLIFSFQTYFYFSILPWSSQIKHYNFSQMMLIIFFLQDPVPGRRTRWDKREIITHRDNLHKSFLNHCMGHASKTTKLTLMLVWAISSWDHWPLCSLTTSFQRILLIRVTARHSKVDFIIQMKKKIIWFVLQGLSEACIALALLLSPTVDKYISHPSPCHSIWDRSRLSGWRAVLLNVCIVSALLSVGLTWAKLLSVASGLLSRTITFNLRPYSVYWVVIIIPSKCITVFLSLSRE